MCILNIVYIFVDNLKLKTMAKKKVMITISESDLKHCKEQSFKKLKDTNVSGYIAVLIQKDKENEKH